jgi:hypothetical protein
MAAINWRTINVDALDPESSANFDLSTLTPALAPVSTADVQHLATQVRQLLRGGDSEGALRGALENAPYGGDSTGKVRCAPKRSLAVLGRATERSTVIFLASWNLSHWLHDNALELDSSVARRSNDA